MPALAFAARKTTPSATETQYTVAGSLLGSWTIDSANSKPTGLTIDPAHLYYIWIVDSGTRRVYRYDAVAVTFGSQSASATFALAAGNTNPQGIADPPAQAAATADARRTGSLIDAALTALVLYDFESPSKPAPGKRLAMIPAVDLALAELAT